MSATTSALSGGDSEPVKNKGGRPSDQAVWAHYEKKEYNSKSKNWTVVCNY